MYGDGLNDPPTIQAAQQFSESGYVVTLLLSSVGSNSAEYRDLLIVDLAPRNLSRHFGPIYRLVRWYLFQRGVRRYLRKERPTVAVFIMLNAIYAGLRSRLLESIKSVACIYDIPVVDMSGLLDRRIFAKGWKLVSSANVVWSSDQHKAELTTKIAELPNAPFVVHNCPRRSYIDGSLIGDPWLRNRIREDGAPLTHSSGTILLRAGAVGEYCGLEQTLEAMRTLPPDYVFIIMGRPSTEYKNRLQNLIIEYGLISRAFVWDRVDDTVWKKALCGADIGHLLHEIPATKYGKRLFGLNSSLSNNRLYQYMAAGLPILTYTDERLNDIYNEVHCFSVQPANFTAETIKRAWIELAMNPFERREMGRSGRLAHLSKYHWDQQFGPIMHALE